MRFSRPPLLRSAGLVAGVAIVAWTTWIAGRVALGHHVDDICADGVAPEIGSYRTEVVAWPPSYRCHLLDRDGATHAVDHRLTGWAIIGWTPAVVTGALVVAALGLLRLTAPRSQRSGSTAVPGRSLPSMTKSERLSWDRDTLPEGAEKRAAVRDMFDAIAPRYDLVNRIMTFRLDVRWRRRTVRTLALPDHSIVLDLAAGTGDLCIDLRESGLRPISVDLSYGMLAADRSGAPRVQGDILRLPFADHSVDGVTCGFALRNLVELPAFFDELARVVRPGGRIALLDVGVPRNRVIRFGNDVYFGKVVPRIGALLSDGAAYRYLPKSVAYLPEPEAMIADLRRAGFGDASHRLLSGGLTQLLAATRDP